MRSGRTALWRMDSRRRTRERIESALTSIHSIELSCREVKLLAIGAVEFSAPGALSAGRPKTARIIDRRSQTRP